MKIPKLQQALIEAMKGVKIIKTPRIKPKKHKSRGKSKRKYANRVPKHYKTYIESGHWTRRKNKYYQSHPRVCVVCGSSSHIDLHHLLYQDYGNEKDEHLVAFCREHHAQFHEETQMKRNMVKDTYNFVTRKQEEIEAYELSRRL